MKIITTYILLLFILLSCKKDDASTGTNTDSHIEFFGFSMIDTYWDDPTDTVAKINYADEVYSFSNLADILVVSPTDNIVERVENFNNYEMKAVLHLNELFFELTDSNSPSNANYDIRPDFSQRWSQFVDINISILKSMNIGAFFIGEEPTWNGISFSELNQVTELLKADFPGIPIMIIESYAALNELQVPEKADWIGFDRYFVENPNNDTEFQQDWEILHSKLSNTSQRIMIVMDSHYIDWAHGDYGNIDLDEMGDVANNYYELAKSDELVIGIIGYFWPNGFDTPESIGARGMPVDIRNEYERIGKEITGKQ